MNRYKVGDKVRVKDWDDLVDEFGMDLDGVINKPSDKYTFVEPMKEFCGQIVTISDVQDNGYNIEEDGGWQGWSDYMFVDEESTNEVHPFEVITKEMFELYKIKNKRYGDSFSVLYDEFGMDYVVPRLVEKVNRIKTLVSNPDLDPDDESIEDSLIDLANYSVMTLKKIKEDKDE